MTPTRVRIRSPGDDLARAGFSLGFDLLFRGTEIVTGGQRRHLYADYVAALERRSETLEGLSGYLEVFRHGMPPHGGFAISRAEPLEVTTDVLRTTHRHHGNALGLEIAAAPLGERLHGVTIAEPFDQHDRATADRRGIGFHLHTEHRTEG